HLLVRLRDVDDSHDARQGLDPTGIDPSVVADESNGRALRARHRMRRISHLVYDRNYALHVCRGRAVTHYYKHDALDLRYGAEPCAARCRSVNQTPAVALGFRCRYGSGYRLFNRRPAQAHTHDGRYTGLLHGHAVHCVGRFGRGARVVRDYDELRVRLELVQHPHEPADVRVVERRVHLVHETERAWLHQEYPEQERQSDKRPLTAREQMNSLCLLAAGRRVDLDVALERRIRILQPYVAVTDAEQRHEDVSEVLAHLHERGEEQLASRSVYFTDRLLKLGSRLIQVPSLLAQELHGLALFLMLLDCKRVYLPERFELCAQISGLCPQRFVLILQRNALGHQLVQRSAPLGFEPLANRGPAAGEFRVAQLGSMQLIGNVRSFPSHLIERMIGLGKRLVRLPYGTLRVRQLGLGVTQHAVTRFEIERPVSEL